MLGVKLVVFDLDGVLVASRDLHYHALNRALEKIDPGYAVTPEEHAAKYDGQSTRVKLDLLSREKGLPEGMHDAVWREKQESTWALIPGMFGPSPAMREMLQALKADGYLLACASNSVARTVELLLREIGVLDLFDMTFSNESVPACKPSPGIYLHAMLHFGVSPYETLVVEDSPIGRRAAFLSRAHVCSVSGPEDVTLERVRGDIASADALNSEVRFDLRWKSAVQVVIPMAGLGSRFSDAGYALPKPLIPVHGRPMIERVIENLNADAEFFVVVMRGHLDRFPELRVLLTETLPRRFRLRVIEVDALTEGPACTVLAAAPHLAPDKPLLIANCDQYVEWDSNSFFYRAANVDGSIQVFHRDPAAGDTKWSYVRPDDQGTWVAEVREKQVISEWASTGLYYWNRASDFATFAAEMIAADERVNGEFYVCPVYNYAVRAGRKITMQPCERMWGIGTPEDLDHFLTHHAPLP